MYGIYKSKLLVVKQNLCKNNSVPLMRANAVDNNYFLRLIFLAATKQIIV